MNSIIILISVVFVAYFTFTITNTKIIKYILTPIIGLLYGFMLLFIGMGIGSSNLYLSLAVLPVIVVTFRIILMKNAK